MSAKIVNSVTISAGTAKPLLDEIKRFYQRNDYTGPTREDDQVVVAQKNSDVVGVVRLVEEQGVVLLRGMYIDETMRRQGIGQRMLESFQDVLNQNSAHETYLICGHHLISFYGRIGFKPVVNSSEAPEFLVQRSVGYAQTYGPQIIMKRDPSPET